MKRSGAFSETRSVAIFVLVILCSYRMGVAQEIPTHSSSPPPAAHVTARDLPGFTMEQFRELEAAWSEMLAEVTRSRREIEALRQEVREAREDLATIRRDLSASKSDDPSGWNASATTSAGQKADSFHESYTRPETSSQSDPARLERSSPGEAGLKASQGSNALQEEQDLLNAKLADLYQTKVESGSKYRLRLTGLVLLNLFGTRGSVDDLDVPSRALAATPADSSGSFGTGIRQSLLGLEIFGPTVGGGKTEGALQFDFLGGFPMRSNGVTESLARLRIAKISFDWERTSIVAGQDTPFFSPLSPSSLASVAYPALSASGNIWTWTPQIRVEHKYPVAAQSSILVQAGILSPLTGEAPSDPVYRTVQAGERAGGPAYAARAAWTHPAFGRVLTVGSGFYFARQDWGFSRVVHAWAASADWDLPLGRWFSLSGEFYRGRAMGGLGAGVPNSVIYSGSPANPSTTVQGLRSSGGWAQLKFKPIERLEFNGAFGEDYPFASDLRGLAPSQRVFYPLIGRNAGAFVNSIYRARSNLLFSVEYRHIWTSGINDEKIGADRLNLGAGILF